MIQRIVQLVFVILFLWIAIYPVDILALSNSVLLQPGPVYIVNRIQVIKQTLLWSSSKGKKSMITTANKQTNKQKKTATTNNMGSYMNY